MEERDLSGAYEPRNYSTRVNSHQRRNASEMEREQIVTNTFRSLPRDVILVAAISAAAAVPRLLFLGKESLWMDEGATVYFAQDCWTFVRPDMPLYYFLLHF